MSRHDVERIAVSHPVRMLVAGGTGAAACPNEQRRVQLQAAFSEDKGPRQTMEDVAVLELDARGEADQAADVRYVG
jgi:hypothetical protein